MMRVEKALVTLLKLMIFTERTTNKIQFVIKTGK